MAVRDRAGALALLEETRVLTLAGLVAAVAGAKVVGSWWGHPKGKLIYSISSELEDHPDVLACKLADGKTTFLHRTLWPALLRVVTDEAWRRERLAALPPNAARVARRVRARPLRLDKKLLSPRERASLERSCLLHVASEHTASGAHATFLRSWGSWAPPPAKRGAAKLTFDAARAELLAAGLQL